MQRPSTTQPEKTTKSPGRHGPKNRGSTLRLAQLPTVPRIPRLLANGF